MSEPIILKAGDRETLDALVSGYTMVGTEVVTWRFAERWDKTAMLTYTTNGGNITISGQTITLVIPAADTVWMPSLALVYEVEVTPLDGSGPFTVSQGRIRVNPQLA